MGLTLGGNNSSFKNIRYLSDRQVQDGQKLTQDFER